MGYRSDVHALLYATKDKWPTLKLFVEENIPEMFKEDIKPFTAGIGGDLIGYYFYAGDVKWYPSYPDVKAFDDFVGKFVVLCDEDEELAFEFVRLGEDDTDIETNSAGDYQYLLELRRQIIPAISLTKED